MMPPPAILLGEYAEEIHNSERKLMRETNVSNGEEANQKKNMDDASGS